MSQHSVIMLSNEEQKVHTSLVLLQLIYFTIILSFSLTVCSCLQEKMQSLSNFCIKVINPTKLK